MVDESVYGTPLTVTRFLEFTDESLNLEIQRLESKGIRVGKRVQRSDRWASGQRKANGDVGFELQNKGMGLLFKHMFGTVQTTGPVSGAYTHVFSPGDLKGKSFTAQKGIVDEGGTARPFTYKGCKIPSWELSAKTGEIGVLKPAINAQDETTATGLATAAYASTVGLLTFAQASLTLGGVATKVREASIKGDNKLTMDRFFLGPLAQEPLVADWAEFTAQLDAEFEDLTVYNRFINGTEGAFSLTFVGDIIGGAVPFSVTVAGNVRYDGETPKVGGPGVTPLSLPVKFLDPGTGPADAIKLTYVTTDTAP